jgi:hypothetical protein
MMFLPVFHTEFSVVLKVLQFVFPLGFVSQRCACISSRKCTNEVAEFGQACPSVRPSVRIL